MDLLTLALVCGPLVNPAMTLRVIDVESGGFPYSIHDNSDGSSYHLASSGQAAGVAEYLIRAGHPIDIGLMQINYDAWLKPAHFSVEQALDPCTNIRLGTTLLSANYAYSLRRSSTATDALARALSLYNSGSESRSWVYAEKVLKGHASHPASSVRARSAGVLFPRDAASR